MGGEELADALVVVNDDRVEGENLPSQALRFKPAGDENGLVEGEWLMPRIFKRFSRAFGRLKLCASR
jgi:hypothetical protein